MNVLNSSCFLLDKKNNTLQNRLGGLDFSLIEKGNRSYLEEIGFNLEIPYYYYFSI